MTARRLQRVVHLGVIVMMAASAAGCDSDDPGRYRVTFGVTDLSEPFISLSGSVRHPSSGALVGSDGGPCAAVSGVNDASFSADGEGALSYELFSVDGFPPGDGGNGTGDDVASSRTIHPVFRCGYELPSAPDEADFATEIIEVVSIDKLPIVPMPALVVTSVVRVSDRSTPLITTTTIENDPPDVAAVAYAVTVGVTNDVGLLGAIQFDIAYGGDSGGFAGAAGSARCFSEVAAALSSFNDKGSGVLSGALIDLDGIPTPGPIATCTFRSRDSVRPTDFSVTVVDASPPATDMPLPEFPVMAVTALERAP